MIPRLPSIVCILLVGMISAVGAGRQLTGVYAPASTPALAPQEAQKKFSVPPGFEVRIFASEPDVINPVAMTWDERGRLWVVELYEYPLGAPKGAKPRDRIKILEDTDLDGQADKVTVFADGLNLATGILLGNGGVYVGQAPELLFLQDTNGDDIADKRTVLLSGFGLHDRHELLNGFAWGPDGWLYMTHGVFTHSEVKDPANQDSPAVKIDAALARFNPRTKRIEVFADGTSNPWGVDFDAAGNAFVSACVIDHLFHLVPGGIYVRQGGTPAHPYGYQLLPSIVDHTHFRAAYAGVNIYQGDQYPASWRGKVFIGNIHQSAINLDTLAPRGSTFKATAEKDFLVANDGWFRPVSTQTGPDGALWIMDWYDKYPCYQNANADPEGIDREHGRIWRVIYTGDTPGKKVPPHPPGMNLASLSSHELAGMLSHPNIWQRRMARRLLGERRDPSVAKELAALVRSGADMETKLGALWSLHGAEQLDEPTLENAAEDRIPAVRAWAARLTGERRIGSEEIKQRLIGLAKDEDPAVRLAVAVACRSFASGSLTLNTPAPASAEDMKTGEVLASLIEASSEANDPVIPFLIWMAGEPAFARDSQPTYDWFQEVAEKTYPLSGYLLKKAMRRICDTREPGRLQEAVKFLIATIETSPRAVGDSIDGLIEGGKGKALKPNFDTTDFFARLDRDPSLRLRGLQLGTLWGDARSTEKVLALARDAKAAMGDRINAVEVVRQSKNEAARQAMLEIVAGDTPEPLAIASMRALSEIGGDETIAQSIAARWRKFSPALRRSAVDLLISRSSWTKVLLDAIEEKTIAAGDLPVTALRTLFRSTDPGTKQRAEKVIGRFRESDSDKVKLIAAKRQVVLGGGAADLKAGREAAQKTCLVCHKFYGEGAEVGPDLTGVGRSNLDALLANVIDPNQVIGKGYENVEIETKDGRNVSGRIVENTDSRVKLLSAGPKEEVVAKGEIAAMRVTELSVMPEGLEQMPDADFRNLIWYILNPPQDNREMTPQLRRELLGQ